MILLAPLWRSKSIAIAITCRFAHVKIPEGVKYSATRELKYEFLDNTADIQVHACIL